MTQLEKLLAKKETIWQSMRTEVKELGIKGILEKYNNRYSFLRNQIEIINKINSEHNPKNLKK